MRFIFVIGFLIFFLFSGLSVTEELTLLAKSNEPITTAHLLLFSKGIYYQIGFWSCLSMFWFGWGRDNADHTE